MNLLLIHDDSMFSALIVEFLRYQRYSVWETDNVETSLTAVAHRQVDLAICILPNEQSDRLSLMAELRRRHPSLPLILLALSPLSDQVLPQVQAYTPYYLTKPFPVASLLSMITHATGIRKTRLSAKSA